MFAPLPNVRLSPETMCLSCCCVCNPGFNLRALHQDILKKSGLPTKGKKVGKTKILSSGFGGELIPINWHRMPRADLIPLQAELIVRILENEKRRARP